jgi:hypothetical protein
MKTFFLTLLTFVLLTSCSKEDNKVVIDKKFQLPPETQTGANTFGVTIRGKVYVPRTPTGFNVGPSPKAMILWGDHTINQNLYNEIEIKDGASAAGFNMIIHIQNLFANGEGQYQLKLSNFQDNIDSTPFNHIYFKIWDAAISNYAYYGSLEDQGVINITKRQNGILSGNFSAKFVRYDNPNDFIEITDGRFDIGPNLYDAIFP